MLLVLFSNSPAKLQTQSSSIFPWELHLLNLWWVRKHYYLPHCAPGKRGAEEKLFCLFVLGSDLICSHQPNRYSFGGVTSFCGCLHDKLIFLKKSQLPVCFIANRSKTFFSRLRFVYFQSAAEYTIHHAPKPGLSVCLLVPSPSLMSPYLLAYVKYYRCSPESCM